MFDSFVSSRILRIGVLGALNTGEAPLAPSERVGAMYIAGLIRHADDLIDAPEYPGFSSADSLRNYILSCRPEELGGVSLEEVVYDACKFFPQDKQDIFVGKGAPGEYSVRDVREYRDATNIPMAPMMRDIVGSNNPNVLRNSQLFQMFDDTTDWKKDAESNTFNMYVAHASEVWNERGRPPGEDLDYLTYMINKPLQVQVAGKPVEVLQGLRSRHMAATRTSYLKTLDAEVAMYGGSNHVLRKATMKLIGRPKSVFL